MTTQFRSQLGMAERLLELYGADLRYGHALGWFSWDGTRWCPDEDGEAKRLAIKTAEACRAQVATLETEAGKRLLQDIGKVESASGMNGMLELAGVMVPITTDPARFDADPNHFNIPEGTLDLTTGGIHEHRRDDLITKLAGAGPSKKDSPLWESFISTVLPDPEVRAFVQRLFGAAMLGKVLDHVLPIFTGTGANGKGTLRDAVKAAFGDYSIEVDPAILMQTPHERHGTFLMDLRGARLVFCSETAKGRGFNEAQMKRLVGGDPIRANRMRRDPVEFDPSHTLVMLTNHLPAVSGDDPAVWRRILVVPFDVVIPPEERDPTLPARLTAEAPAILRWCYLGWLDYQQQGLNAPAAVRARTEEYQAESDVLGRFLSERTMTNPHAYVRARELFEEYTRWCRQGGEEAETETALGRALVTRGLVKKLTKIGTIYQGVGLLAADDEDAAA